MVGWSLFLVSFKNHGNWFLPTAVRVVQGIGASEVPYEVLEQWPTEMVQPISAQTAHEKQI